MVVPPNPLVQTPSVSGTLPTTAMNISKSLNLKRYYSQRQTTANLAAILAPFQERINDADNIPEQQRLDFG